MDHHQLEVVVRVLLEEMAAAGRCHCWAISPEVLLALWAVSAGEPVWWWLR